MYGTHMAGDYGTGVNGGVPQGHPMVPMGSNATRASGRARTGTAASSTKIDPSFKSKRYRDKLREQIKALENLLPVDKATLHRKLDSQTVFRLAISYFRIQNFLRAAGISSDSKPTEAEANTDPLLQQWNHHNHTVANAGASVIDAQKEVKLALEALDSFLLVVTADGTILYTTENISSLLGFHPVDLVHRCIYGIVHPDDHDDVKKVLEENLVEGHVADSGTEEPKRRRVEPKKISFLCRMKCFNGTSTGHVKMLCNGSLHTLPEAVKSRTSPCQVMFASFQLFSAVTSNTDLDSNRLAFWTRHKLDFTTTAVDDRIEHVLGTDGSELLNSSFYNAISTEDLAAMYTCHKTLLETEDSHVILMRMKNQSGAWVWLHSYGRRLTTENDEEIIFTHTVPSENDLPYLQQEDITRGRYAHEEYLKLISTASQEGEQYGNSTSEHAQRRRWTSNDTYVVASQMGHKLKDDYSVSLHSPHGACPSSFHQSSDYPSEIPASSSSESTPQESTQRRAFAESNTFIDSDYRHHPQIEGAHHRMTGVIGDSGMVTQYGDMNPALSMYQMVAHLPPEMYDMNTYRKHAIRMMESARHEWYHHRVPTAPHLQTQGRGDTCYPHASDAATAAAAANRHSGVGAAPPTPPSTPNMLSYNHCSATESHHYGYACPPAWSEHYRNSLPHPQAAEYCASYYVNGEVQVKLVRNTAYPWRGSGCYGEGYHSRGKPSEHEAVNGCGYPTEGAFHRVHENKPGFEGEITCRHSKRYAYYTEYDRDRLPCPMANTKDGCLARRLQDPGQAMAEQQGYYDDAVLSQLPPINSFLGFLQEELPSC